MFFKVDKYIINEVNYNNTYYYILIIFVKWEQHVHAKHQRPKLNAQTNHYL